MATVALERRRDLCERLPQAALQEADRILVVAAPSPLGLDDLVAQYPVLIEKLGLAVERPRPWLVLNGGGGGAQARIESRLKRELDLPVGAYIPHDRPAVDVAEAHHLPLTVDRPGSPAAKVLIRVADGLWHALAADAVARGLR